MGEIPLDDRQRLLRHQRNRAGHRLPAAPLAGRVLRARPGQDRTARASCCSRRASFPTAARGWTSSSIRRTSCSSALTVAARCRSPSLLKAIGMTPEEILATFFEFDNFRLHGQGRATRRWCPSACAAKWPGSTSTTQIGQGDRRQGQAHHRQAHPRAGARPASRRSPCPMTSCSAVSSPSNIVDGHRRDRGQAPTTS